MAFSGMLVAFVDFLYLPAHRAFNFSTIGPVLTPEGEFSLAASRSFLSISIASKTRSTASEFASIFPFLIRSK